MDDRYRKNDSGSLELLNSPHLHDTSKYNCLKEDNMTNDWTLYAKDGGRVEIYSISQFGDDLQLSRFPPFENVRDARWGHSESTGPWRSLMVKISRGSDVEPCQAPLVSFHSGCFIGKVPQCKVYKTFVCRWSSLFAMFRKHVESPSWTFSFSLSFHNGGFYWEIMRVVLRNALGLKQH